MRATVFARPEGGNQYVQGLQVAGTVNTVNTPV
jgi:hypothetical protein